MRLFVIEPASPALPIKADNSPVTDGDIAVDEILRDKIANLLREKHGIDTRIAYPMPLFKQEVYASGRVKCRYMECPVAEEVTSQILNLPIFPDMSEEMVETVVYAIRDELTQIP